MVSNTLECRRNESNLRNFTLKQIQDIPRGLTGVYEIWYKSKECLYVGKSENQDIYKRLEGHWEGSHNEGVNTWKAAFPNEIKFTYHETTPEQAGPTEACLIRLLTPRTNIRKERIRGGTLCQFCQSLKARSDPPSTT